MDSGGFLEFVFLFLDVFEGDISNTGVCVP